MVAPQPRRIASPDELPDDGAPADWPPFGRAELARHAPDAHWRIDGAGGETEARCSLWWRATPPYGTHRVGLIGHWASRSAEAARRLLAHACAELGAQGCTIAIGPMDGSTWNSYRLVTERGTEPPFFLEPFTPAPWPDHFRASGFVPLAGYSSALAGRLEVVDPRVPEIEARLARDAVTVRQLDPTRFEEELSRIYDVATVSFRRNFLYTPIPREAFVAQYAPVRAVVHPALVLVAERAGAPVGFGFSLPDISERLRGEPVRTAIVKTIAVLPGRTYAGLGAVLVARMHVAARELGLSRAVHALMHDANSSRGISARSGTTMRRYTLFARPLSS